MFREEIAEILTIEYLKVVENNSEKEAISKVQDLRLQNEERI